MNTFEKLQKLYSQIDALIEAQSTYLSPEFKAWYAECERILGKCYGEDSIEIKNFLNTQFQSRIIDNEQQRLWCRNGLETTKSMFANLLDDFEEEENNATEDNKPIKNNNVFIVHGHDGELKYQIARLLEKLDLEPIILHEQVNTSRTIIEKIEKYGKEAQAAIILFTPDDVGRANSETDIKARGRQNVVFEAGYFMGLLGRSNTILVVSDDSIELPGDLSGVVYSGVSSEFEIARELRAMGFEVDANKLM